MRRSNEGQNKGERLLSSAKPNTETSRLTLQIQGEGPSQTERPLLKATN